MKLNAENLISKYKKYGFEYKKSYSNDSYLTFTFKSGFFHNAEIIKITSQANNSDENHINEVREDLRKLGYSEKFTENLSFEEIENELFNGFFDVENWKKRIFSEYKTYTEKIINIYSDKESLEYKYIDSPYSILNQKEEPKDSIIDDIIKKINESGTKLILIEAPAGFGKTSTSYELLNKLALDETKPIPFFTEFSRDRQAKIFSHVFVREVDRVFSQVKSSLVEDELKNGRIVMILDGFDELLSETSQPQGEANKNYENAEPMLETIGDLLSNEAKIIITSRRSAIFDDYVFEEWLDRFHNKFEFIRYRIDSPKIDDWLTNERKKSLEDVGISINSMANPVLLSYLRFLKEDNFNDLCKEPNKIVDQYFYSMLERERERQNLLMSPEKQNEILTLLAADMCENDYTSDLKENIITFFKEKALNILEETRKLYKFGDRPSLDSLCNTLSNHAFFNRNNQDNTKLEFINEFILGNYIAEGILKSNGDWMANNERFVEPAVISYLPRTSLCKAELWDSLRSMIDFLDISIQMKFEFYLLNKIKWERYNETSISSIELSNVNIFNQSNLKEITFSNCIFYDSDFYFKNIGKATFINCKFYNCKSINHNDNILILNCFSNNEFIESIEFESEEISYNNDEIAKFILSKFWKLGSDKIERIHIPLASIFKQIIQKGYNRDDVIIKLKNLKRKEILLDANDGGYITLNTQKISEIKEILGK
ncbi:NACHT domain-containing protein [Haemophilus parainfluenzae]|jgi:hypothetical protein E4_15868|uniref:NACHT domain-containing protein n=1 Tax=Haemophilus parainfluenzae TaxID=729 RepID=UPI00066EB682|nr:NACHT domain-containing protein [Haemophilus parainfluenzae]